jgi:hypothetical protein
MGQLRGNNHESKSQTYTNFNHGGNGGNLFFDL